MNGLVIGALMALSMVQQTDTVFAVGDATRLQAETSGGTIQVSTWDRNEVRIQAEHSRRTYVDIDRGGTTIRVEAEARRGPGGIVDFRITVPRSFGLELGGMYTDITVEGADGEVEAETLQGDVTIRGGRGTVKAGSTTGKILVDGARGVVEAEGVAEEIRIVNSSGEIYAESVGSNIILENVDARIVDVGTLGGRIRYAGTFARDGTYFFGAHGGSVTLVVPDGAGASFTLATIHGSIQSNLPGAPERFERGQRTSFQLGAGGATVEVETFAGAIRVVRAGTEGTLEDMDRGHANLLDDNALGDIVQAALQGIDQGMVTAVGQWEADDADDDPATSRR